MIYILKLVDSPHFKVYDFNIKDAIILMGAICFLLILNWSSLRKKVALNSLNCTEVNYDTIGIDPFNLKNKRVSVFAKIVLAILAILLIGTPFNEFMDIMFYL